MAERDVEKYLNEQVKKLGGFSRKWTSPSHVGVQDRIAFLPGGEVWFIEIKDTGKKPTSAQWREIMRQRELGANAGYLAGKKEVDEFFWYTTRILREVWMRAHVNDNITGEAK